jgi:hypothetical protein
MSPETERHRKRELDVLLYNSAGLGEFEYMTAFDMCGLLFTSRSRGNYAASCRDCDFAGRVGLSWYWQCNCRQPNGVEVNAGIDLSEFDPSLVALKTAMLLFVCWTCSSEGSFVAV